jgi:outer membrane protein
MYTGVTMRDDSRRRWRGLCLDATTTAILSLLLLTGAQAVSGQTPANPPASASAKPVVITLQEAIRRAETSEPAYASAKAASQSAALGRSIARAGLLPTARLYNQDIYTQPNGIYAEGGEGVLSPDPKFVANDSRPREYIAQGIVDETLGLAGPAAVRRADASAAQARAQLEIARRGLVVTVTSFFYTALTDDNKVAVAKRALQYASNFTKLTTEREQKRESSHADVVKAQLTEQQNRRALQDAQLADETARLNLGVLLFPNPETPYTLSAPTAPPPLASRADVAAAASKNNPQLKSALAALQITNADVMAAQAAYVPDILLNVTYGIDANEFAVNGPLTPDGAKARNLGYSTTVTVNLPVWDWLATEHKVKQSEILRSAAKVALNATQRQLIAELDQYYSAAQVARDELASLDQSVATAAESLRLTRLAYTGGDATVLEVVSAQDAYVAAENARDDGRVRYETALAQLQTLTGVM